MHDIFRDTITDFDGLRFVIARYGENLDWVPEILSRFPGAKCTVYNKGSDDIDSNISYEIVPLENVGRESHTYLHHIIDNYDCSPKDADEVTVFLQGRPFDHCLGEKTLFELVHASVLNVVSGSLFENVGTQIIEITGGAPTFHMSIEDELTDTSLDLFDKTLPESFRFSAGALFVTCRSCISKRPVGFYEDAIAMLDVEVNPIRGFCFERLWSLIFS